MRLCITVTFIALSIVCSAQKKFRVVFFRMDAAVGAKSSSLGEWRAYTDELLKNNAVIAEMRSSSIFIYNTDTLQGEYFLSPKVSSDFQANKIKLTEHKSAIVFIKISLSNKTPITSHSEVISFEAFDQCYNHAKWLRSDIQNAGYASLKELINGFDVVPPDSLEKMQKQQWRQIKRNLTDTVYFSNYDIPSDQSSAEYFSLSKMDSNTQFLVTDYFLSSGKIKNSVHFITLDSESRTGLCLEYYNSGNLKSKGDFIGNRRAGNWEYYYDTAGNPLWYKCAYKNGNTDGVLKSYYLDGKLKREEFHQLFLDTVFSKQGKKQSYYVRKQDSILSGRCFDRNNKQIQFTPFEKLPAPAFNLPQFLAKILRYPDFARKHDVEGRVLIRFTIDDNGHLQDPTVIRSVSDEIDREALRAVNSMPLWHPGIQDDKQVRVVFTLPIVFKLD